MPLGQGRTAIVHEQAIQDALAVVRNGQFTSILHTAMELNLPDSTLYDHAKGISSLAQAHAKQQNLTEAEENALVKWITQLTASGYPARHATVCEMAEQIRVQRVISVNDNDIEYISYQPLRKH